MGASGPLVTEPATPSWHELQCVSMHNEEDKRFQAFQCLSGEISYSR